MSTPTETRLTFDTCYLTSTYRVEMTIADDTAEGLFVGFDGG